MEEFKYVITDKLGIHARPAGQLVKTAKSYSSKITLNVGENSAEATKLMAIMALGAQIGTEVHVTAEGTDEAEACKAMKIFFAQNF